MQHKVPMSRLPRLSDSQYVGVRRAENTGTVAAYILGNPIRARLVERVEDYPFWGSTVYGREELIEFVSRRT